MLVHESSISYHEHPIKSEKVVDNAINDKKNLFETMYKICLVCFVEAVKIIGHKLQEHLVQVSKSSISQKKGGKSSWPHPVPSRTHSRIIKINSKRWIKKQLSKKSRETEVSSDPTCISSEMNRLSRSKSLVSANRKKFGQSLNLSRHYLGRRHSYPPFRSSKLEMVLEEE